MLSVSCLVIYMYMFIVIILCTEIINNSIIHVHGVNTIHTNMEYKPSLYIIQTLSQILGSALAVKSNWTISICPALEA